MTRRVSSACRPLGTTAAPVVEVGAALRPVPVCRRAWTKFRRVRLSPRDYTGRKPDRWFRNSRYVVALWNERREHRLVLWHLSIRSIDRSARHDWRDFQRIKNELCGPEFEATEVYPAESRLVDMSNQFHLWVFRELDYGFAERAVSMTAQGRARQRRR
jgi:hypothetical protein